MITMLLLKTYIVDSISNGTSKILKVIFSEKMIMLVVLSLFEKLVKSTSNNFDDQILDTITNEMKTQGYIV